MSKSNRPSHRTPNREAPREAGPSSGGPNATYVLLALNGLLVAVACLAPIPTIVSRAVLAAAALLGVWQVILLLFVGSPARTLRIDWNIRAVHYVQLTLQSSLYTYWGLYWEEVGRYAPLLVAQLLFAYLFDMLMCWSRRRTCLLGFGQCPIILSINLFLWFRADYYFCQFLLIALAYLGKDFVTWTIAGRKKHIFNPSGFALAVVSVLLLLTQSYQITHAADIIQSFTLAPNFYEVVFLLSLVVQLLFGTASVTLGAVLALVLMFYGGALAYGRPLFAVAVDPSVFLGVSLLVTDPSTSPRSSLGKFLFGLVYGGGIFVACVVFHYWQQPAIFDKILMVIVVNLMVPWLDRIGQGVQGRFSSITQSPLVRFERFVWIALYIALFIRILPAHKATTWLFESPLPPSAASASEDVNRRLFNRVVSQFEHPEVYAPFGFRGELSKYRSVKGLLGMEKAQAETRLLEAARAAQAAEGLPQ